MITRGGLVNNGGATHWPSIVSSTMAKYRFFPGDGLDPERPAFSFSWTSSNCNRCSIDSTGATSGIDNFAIRWSMDDGGGLIAGVIVEDFLFCKGVSWGGGVRVDDLSPSINFLTVSDIFGGAGIEGLGSGVSRIFANCGAETWGVGDFRSCCVFNRSRETFGTLGLGVGLGISGRLRCRDSSILEFGRVLGDVLDGLGFLNGVTSLNDGTAGAGFTIG